MGSLVVLVAVLVVAEDGVAMVGMVALLGVLGVLPWEEMEVGCGGANDEVVVVLADVVVLLLLLLLLLLLADAADDSKWGIIAFRSSMEKGTMLPTFLLLPLL